ncbi:MAG: phage antirepressor KilAC domain-containing protein [Christensenellaceae bacterium]|nr:phage antirepressor KilAC domain-containing protein [Christensenellaceae bacterium]
MNNMIRKFHDREFGSIDILMIDGNPYFPAVDCATTLGYKTPRHAVTRHCKGGMKRAVPTNGGVQEKIYIPEGDLYRLITRSTLPAAERFASWVFDEVLPTIRKHGAYATHDTLDELLRSPKYAETLIKRLEEERRKSGVLEDLATEMAPKALYCDMILQCKNVVPVSLIAKDYGMSAAVFNKLLHDLGVQYKTGGTWLLYQKYAQKGYTRTRTYRVGEHVSAMHTCWTQKGRLFLYEFLGDFGIYPLMEFPFDEPLPA